MEKQYPQLYKQGDFPQTLGTNKSTISIATSGCFVSSLAMKAVLYGHQVTPAQLNIVLVGKGIFIQENLLPDNALSQVFSDIHYIKTFDYEPIHTDLANIANLLADPATTLTIRINLGNGNLHFVEAVACDGTTLHIANPLSGQIEDFSKNYGSPITANLHVLVYTGPVPQVAVPTQPAPSTDTTGVAQRFSQAITKSTNFDTVCSFLGIPQDQAVQRDLGANLVIDKFKFLQKEVEDQQKVIDDLQKAKPVVAPAAPVAAPVVASVPVADVTPATPPVTPPVASEQPIHFQDGSLPIPGTGTQSAPPVTIGQKSPSLGAGASLIASFIRGVFRVLFM